MVRVVNFLIAQESESAEDFRSLVKPLNEIFDIRSRQGEKGIKVAEQVIDTVIEWEKDTSIYTSLEKTLNDKFYIA